ncbi:MAG: SCO family protein [Pseudomonadota bacterium]
MQRRTTLRLVLWGLVVVAAGAAGIGWFVTDRQGERTVASTAAGLVGGPFRLVDPAGEVVSDESLRGRPFAVFFGFTHCPDVCPTSLWEMSTWIDALGDDAERLGFLFVTVDPERDTPEVMGAYVGSFSDRIVGLTGDRASVDEVIKGYRVYARKIPLEGDDYTMDHSAMVYLMDENGAYSSHISFGTPPERAVEMLRTLL